ncbi:MAG TPA: hypothetical protein VK718_05485 [Ferruginibacter sp.]|jgi:hypothetical protein|nr:hypothetical protein [Ferruginibacter sp.]
MRKQVCTFLAALFFIAVFTQCNTGKIDNKTSNNTDTTLKYQSADPFKNSMAQSRFFTIDSKQDNVVEGDAGTIVVCPKGCFKSSKGEIVSDSVTIELAEALSLGEMILSNLTTTSGGNQLQTDGMIYFNAASHGEQLVINKDNPIHIEIPTKEKIPGMMAYKGIRDAKGNMNWINPKILDNYLVPIDLDQLDFLPEGFQAAVEEGMPYKGHVAATTTLTDSLYYSLSVSNGVDYMNGMEDVHLNEPYYNDSAVVVNGKYTRRSFETDHHAASVKSDSAETKNNWGIDPAIIKLIKSKKYQHTLIATKEFEKRLQVIFKTCNNTVLEIYTKNTGKNLYELDSLAAIATKGTSYENDFHDFYLQKLTNVKGADKYAELLSNYYTKQLAKIRADLQAAKEKVVKELNKKNKEMQQITDNYRKLLWQREKYRMQTYGFNWTETGWINIDTGTIPKTWGPQTLQITVQNSKKFDRIYTYVVYTTIKSLYRLNTDDNELFYVGNDEDKKMLMPKHNGAVAITIAYTGDTSYLAIKQFETGTDLQFTMLPERSSKDKIKEAINAYDKYAKENQISVDLQYMDKFYIEQLRQKALLKEREFIDSLWPIAYPCCPNTMAFAEK